MCWQSDDVFEVSEWPITVRVERVPDRFTACPYWRLDVFEFDELIFRDWDYWSREDAQRNAEQRLEACFEGVEYGKF